MPTEDNELPPSQRPDLRIEAGESLFDAQLDDSAVDLFIQGSWTSGMRGAYGVALHPPLGPSGRRFTSGYRFPGMESVPFYNFIDLTVSLWLYERFFFETTFVDEFRVYSLILGYQGLEDEFVQSVQLGNANFSISEYPYLRFEEGTEPSPGASALFETANTRHELLLRYEPTGTQSALFIGMNEVSERRIAPSRFIEGQYFVLPDDNVENLRVYIEDKDGSHTAQLHDSNGNGARTRFFREADLDEETRYSASEGYVFLREPAEGRVLVYYDGVGQDGNGTDALVGELGTSSRHFIDPGSQSNFAFSETDTYYGLDLRNLQVPIEGRDALLIYDPGAFNPFELQSHYSLNGLDVSEDTELESLFVRPGKYAELDLGAGLEVSLTNELDAVAVIDPEAGLRDAANRYPFLTSDPEYPRIYGPRRTTERGATDLELLLRVLNPVNNLSIGSDAVPGSARVLRNGREDGSFTVDYDTGRISTPFPVSPDDVIEVTYRTYTPDALGGELVFGSGNVIRFTDELEMQLALGLRWNLVDATYSTAPDDYPGTVTTSGSLSYDTPNLQAYLDGAVEFRVPDTTGYLRLLGMEEKETRLAVREHTIVPSAPPLNDDEGAGDDPPAALAQDNRGILLFRDYNRYDAFGNPSLQDYDWSLPSDQLYPYEDGSRIGPYNALADGDGIDGQVMVMEFELADGDDHWVGAQLRPEHAQDLDLSGVSGLRFRWNTEDLDEDDDISVYLQIGALDEDLDGDDTLDRGRSRLNPSFPFQDGNRSIELFAGGGIHNTDFINSEDANRNEILDRENSKLIVTKKLYDSNGNDGLVTELPAGSDWPTVRVSLSAAERERLRRVRGARVLIVRNGGTAEIAGRAMFSSFTFEGSTFAAEIIAPATGEVLPPGTNADGESELAAREVRDPDNLRGSFSEVTEIFHPTGGDGQRVLLVDWRNLDDTQAGAGWRLRDYVTPVPIDQYENLVFYLNLETVGATNAGDDELVVRLLDGESRGVTAEIPLTGVLEYPSGAGDRTGWRRVEISLADREVYVATPGSSASRLSGAEVRVDSLGGSRRVSRLEFEFSGRESGRIYIDEVHWRDAQLSVEGAASASLAYQYPDTILELGEFPVLANLRLREDLAARSGGFSPESEFSDRPGSFSSRTGAGADIARVSLDTEFEVVRSEDAVTTLGGHQIQAPAEPAPVMLFEEYRRNYNAFRPSMSRRTGVRLERSGLGLLRFDSTGNLRDTRLQQDWRAQTSSLWDGNWRLRAEGRLGQTASGYVLPNENYFASWVDAYTLTIPWENGTSTRRSGETEFRLDYERERFAVNWHPSLAYQNLSVTEERQRNRGALRLRTPFRAPLFDPVRLTLTPSYTRTFSNSAISPDNQGFGDDLRQYFEEFGRQDYIYGSPPFAELFTDAENLSFAEASEPLPFARYSPATALEASRPFGSHWRDLLIPSSARSEVQRTLTRDGDALSDRRQYGLSFTTAAVNLFGRRGAYPRFNLYQSDEFRNTVSYRLREAPTGTIEGWDTQVTNELGFFGREHRRLEIENRVLLERNDEFARELETEARFRWRWYPITIFGSERLQQFVERGAFYRHTERVKVTARRYDENPQRDLVTVVLGHETSLEIPDRGSIRAYLDLGWGIEPFEVTDDDYVNQIILGIQGGVEARFQY